MGSRMGAGRYLLAMSAVINLWCLAMIALHHWGLVPMRIDRHTAWLVAFVCGSLVGLVFFVLTRRRLHDLDFPSVYAFVFALPLPGVIFLPLLCFVPSQRWANRFGDSPGPSGFLTRAFAVLFFGLALLLCPYVTRLYAYAPIGE